VSAGLKTQILDAALHNAASA